MLKKIIIIISAIGFFACTSTSTEQVTQDELTNQDEQGTEEVGQDNDSKIPSKMKFVTIKEYASCVDMEIHDKDGKLVEVPTEVAKGLECPMTVRFSPSQKYLLYMNNWEIKIYNFETGEMNYLMTFLDTTEGLDCIWGPEGKHLACVSVNQQEYDSLTKIFVLDVREGKLFEKRQYPYTVDFICGGNCYPDGFWFEDEYTLKYKGHKAMEDEGKVYTIDLNSAPPVYEEKIGYIEDIYEKEGKHYIDIDYIQFLSDTDEIVEVLKQEGACPGGEYKCAERWGFYISNQSSQIRTFEISDEVEIFMQTYSHNSDGNFQFNEQIPFETFQGIFTADSLAYLREVPYHVKVEDSIVTKIEEQYLP